MKKWQVTGSRPACQPTLNVTWTWPGPCTVAAKLVKEGVGGGRVCGGVVGGTGLSVGGAFAVIFGIGVGAGGGVCFGCWLSRPNSASAQASAIPNGRLASLASRLITVR